MAGRIVSLCPGHILPSQLHGRDSLTGAIWHGESYRRWQEISVEFEIRREAGAARVAYILSPRFRVPARVRRQSDANVALGRRQSDPGPSPGTLRGKDRWPE